MDTTKNTRARGRPRRFDPEAAVGTAKHLFHARGYDAVGVAEITSALGINPPSFYAAFGSKMGLYRRVLDRYAVTDAIPLADILKPGRPVAEGVAAALEDAARRYAADPTAAGCLVIEGTRCNDEEARHAARAVHEAAGEMIRAYVAVEFPEDAERVADFVCTTTAGLSAMARNGLGLDRLLEVAGLAGETVARELAAAS